MEFETDPRLGIGGGGIYHEQNGDLTLEPNPKFHVRGATKIYKRECWEKLGGLLRAPGWDTVDEVKANMLGWTTRSFPHLKVSHYRFTGAADGAWKDCVKNGRANYIAGYHPVFMLFKCMRRLVAKPYLFGAMGLLWGFSERLFCADFPGRGPRSDHTTPAISRCGGFCFRKASGSNFDL